MRTRIEVVAIIALSAVCGFGAADVLLDTPSASPSAPARASSVCHYGGRGLYALPDPDCTPGEWVDEAPLVDVLCSPLYNERPGVDVSGPLKTASMRRYGVAPARRRFVEADHYFPRWLGGATTAKNIWPELNYRHARGFYLNPKDRLEFVMYEKVCRSRTLTIRRARAEFEREPWPTLYRRYVRAAK